MLADPWRDEDAACRSLYAILGVPVEPLGARSYDVGDVLEHLAYDHEGTGSITGALRAARENARGAREVVSSEMWECLNSAWHDLPAQRRQARRFGPHAYLGFVRRRAALFFGLADSTMCRDDGWRFTVLGRSLERVDMTARLLSVRVLDAVHAPDWATLLTAAGADESFVRIHGGSADPARVPEFLLLERDFPRSALHALARAEDCLHGLGTGVHDRSAVGRSHADQALRAVGRMRTRLEYLDAHDLERELPRVLRDLQQACITAARAVSEQFFPYEAPVAWAQEGV
jgi:uncharacterized alpha-E superfamily protein